jgi:outer membrane immunogenic protein
MVLPKGHRLSIRNLLHLATFRGDGHMHKFRTQLLTTTAVLALSGAAYAADLPVKAPPPVAPVAPVTNWTGFYVGAQFGGASLDPSCNTTATGEGAFIFHALPCQNNNQFPADLSNSTSLSTAGVLGGGRIGYDFQWWDRLVVGVVGQFDWTDLKGTSQITSFNGSGSLATATASEKLDWLASARGRVGWAFDNVLFYATGGVAWARFKDSASFGGTDDPDDAWATPETSTTKTGAVAGGGFEYRWTPHVSVVGEFLWYGFGGSSVSAVNHEGIVYTTSFHSQDIVAGTLGLNYRF